MADEKIDVKKDAQGLLNKRLLARRKFDSDLLEIQIDGISPSGKYLKVGGKWMQINKVDSDYEILEILK